MALASGSYSSKTAGFKLSKKYHLDSRLEYDTISDMAKAKDVQMPEMVIGFCMEDHGIYLYNKANEKDEVLGKWRKYENEPKTYEHQQSSNSKKWIINHNLGIQRPNVKAFDQDGNEAIGDITYSSENKVIISFCKPISGVAYIS